MACASLIVPVVIHTTSRAANGGYVHGGVSMEARVQFVAFCFFECSIGLFWPSMMKMRSQYVPDEKLSTVINCFRMPVNAIVCLVLFNISNMHLETVFAMCAFFLFACAVLQRLLHQHVTAENGDEKSFRSPRPRGDLEQSQGIKKTPKGNPSAPTLSNKKQAPAAES